MGQRLEVEGPRRTPLAQDFVLGIVLARRHANAVAVAARSCIALQFGVQQLNVIDAGVGCFRDQTQTGCRSHIDAIISPRSIRFDSVKPIFLGIFGDQNRRQNVGNIIARLLYEIGIDAPEISRPGMGNRAIDRAVVISGQRQFPVTVVFLAERF